MANESTPPGGNSTTSGIIEKIKNHPIIAVLAALGLAIAFLANLMKNLKDFEPTADAAPVVRIQRFQVSGDAVSLMLLGKIDDRLKETLGGRPVVWQNDVYRATLDLHRRFARPLGANQISETLSDPERQSISADTPLIKGAIDQSIRIDPERAFALAGQPVEQQSWQIAFVEEMTAAELPPAILTGALPAPAVQFSKTISCKEAGDLLRAEKAPESRLYAELAKDSCTDMKIPIIARFLDDSCGGEGWNVELILPRMSMSVLVIQNISGKPIKINKIVGGDGSEKRVGDGSLLPEDRLIIPTSLSLDIHQPEPDETLPTIALAKLSLPDENVEQRIKFNSRAGVEEEAPASDENAENQTAEAAQVDSTSEDEGEQSEAAVVTPVTEKLTPQFELSVQQIRERYGDARSAATNRTNIVPEYVVAKLEVDGMDVSVDPASAGGTYISNSYPGASCPHLYMAVEGKANVSLGKILVGRDSPARMGSNRRHLPSWPDKIIVAEHDPEITYLNGISLTCERADGTVHREAASMAQFPVTLNRGEQIPFSFDKPAPVHNCQTIYVEVSGYYIPTKE